MAVALNEDQLMLRESASGFMKENAGPGAFRRLRDSAPLSGYDDSLWLSMIELGWTGIAIPTEHGGLGFGYIGLGIILEEIGRGLAVTPFQSSVLISANAILAAGSEQQKAEFLPSIMAGDLIATLALQEGDHHNLKSLKTYATADGEGFVLSGGKVFVQDAHIADKFIVAASSGSDASQDDAVTLFIVDAAAQGVKIERVSMVDGRNSGTIHFDRVGVSRSTILGELNGAGPALERICDIASVGFSAELLGLSLEAFERTMEYLRIRQQFGQFIGAFQGLQHRASHMYSELEVARSIVLSALLAIDKESAEISTLAAAAKAKLCEVSRLVTREAIQMHGGIGMTDEFDIGFFLKRARVAEHSFGDYSYHLDRYASLSGY